MSSMPVLRPQGTPTIFGDLEEKNVTFLVDTSGSMYPFMDVVKEHLLEVLLSRAYRVKDTSFNIMEFSSNVVPWADQMVKCTPQTVTLAGEWIKGLKCKTGTNTLDALLAAFGNPSCNSVYLITDGLPDQPPEVILQHVSLAGQSRPVHCVYLTGTNTDTPAFDFLQSLAIESAGSFHMISVSMRGAVEHVKAVVKVNHGRSKQDKIEDNPTAATTDTPASSTTNSNIPQSTMNQENTSNPPVEEVHISQLTDSIQGSIHSAPEVIPQLTDSIQHVQGSIQSAPEVLPQFVEAKEIPVKLCSVQTSLDNSPVPQEALVTGPVIQPSVLQTQDSVLRYPNTAWETYRIQPRLLQRQVMKTETKELGVSSGAVFVSGMRVLARRDRDGLYCPGMVKEQVTTNRCYLIEFEKDPNGGKSQHRLQETGVYDIIPHNTAMRHPIVPGDKVLAPMDDAAYCFGPGTVLEGIEGRSSGCAADSENLVISLYNGKSVKVTAQMAVWIPQNLHERIKLETQMPLSARQYLINNPQYPTNMPTGYMLVPNTDISRGETLTELRSSAGQPMYVPVYPMATASGDFHMPSMRESVVKSAEVHKLIPGTSMTREDLNRKVMSQLIENKMIKSEEITTYESLQPKSCLKKSVSFRGTNGELDSGISSTQTDDEEKYEEKQDAFKERYSGTSQGDELEDDIETLEVETHGINFNDTDDSGIGTEPALLFSMSDHRKPRRPQSSIPERRPPWRHFSKGSSGGTSKSEVKPFRETALKCPPQARSQPIYIDAELAFDSAPPTYLESRPTSVLSTYDNDYICPTERPQSQYEHRKAQDHPSLRSSVQYDNSYRYPADNISYPTERPQSQYELQKSRDNPSLRSSVQYENSYRYPADNISPNSKKISTKMQHSPMMQAEKIYYYDPQTYPVGVIHRDGVFDTVDHAPVPVPDGPINRKSVFRTVNKDGIKSDRIQMEWLLRNNHNRPHPPVKNEAQRSPVPTHKAFATRDMVREAKETAYMEYRRMQVVAREDSFKEKEATNQNMHKARLDRCRKFTADVHRRDIQRQQDSQEKLNRTREAKRAVSFKISDSDQSRAERESDKEQARQQRLQGITQRRMDIEAQREKEIQDTIARRRDIKTQNMTARSISHLEQIGEYRQQEAARDVQKRHKEIKRREHFHKIETDNQKRKDMRLAMHENKIMDLRSQVLP
ncbi:uncharacterized protein [Amphiura filiformis]|uniref:uncharacterized protein isoform X2 n=1 Tax=Amphiura filiformis TaxID=82378 RepID=UPI003B20D552